MYRLTLKISASRFFEVLVRFEATSLSWFLPETISHDAIEKLIFSTKGPLALKLRMPAIPSCENGSRLNYLKQLQKAQVSILDDLAWSL